MGETKEETLDMGDPRLSKAPQSPTTTDNTWTVGENVKIEVVTYRHRGEIDRPGDAPSGPVACTCIYDGKITATANPRSVVRTATVEYKLPSGEKKEETLRMDDRRLRKISISEAYLKQQAQSSEPGFFSQMGQHVSNGYSGAKNALSRLGDRIWK